MKFKRALIVATGLAHAMAWAAFLGMAFSPSFYSGTSTTAIGPDGSGGEVVELTASIIEINGWGVLIPLLVPVVLTAVGLLAAISWENHQHRNKIFLWVSAVLLTGFCILGMLSIGIFYLPAALLLLVAAVVISIRPRSAAQPTPSA